MKKQIIIDYSLSLIRFAIISEGVLSHLYVEDPLNETMQNKIVQGQVTDVVKNLKAAFVDFGEDKKGLLHFSQVPEAYRDRMQVGLRLPVQVAKENKGEKGHKLTAFITIPSQYFICLPFEKSIGISKQIKDKDVREDLKEWLYAHTQGEYGLVVRTQAADMPRELLDKELELLMAQTHRIMKLKDSVSKGTLLLEDEPFYIQMMREHLSIKDEIEVIYNESTYKESIEAHFKGTYEELTFKFYESSENLFSIYSIEKEYEETLKQKVWLKNGGNIVIDYTEAMTVIDVNSAKAIQKKNTSKTVWELNTLAVEEALQQIVLRNLGGIILIDLVEFKDKTHKEAFNTFVKTLIHQIDGKRSTAYPLTELGLLQIARTKKYTPIYQKLYKTCTHCHQNYSSYTDIYITFLIEQKIKQTALHTIHKKLYIKCSSSIASFLNKENFIDKFKMRYAIHIEIVKDEKEQYFEILHHV